MITWRPCALWSALQQLCQEMLFDMLSLPFPGGETRKGDSRVLFGKKGAFLLFGNKHEKKKAFLRYFPVINAFLNQYRRFFLIRLWDLWKDV